ncbi:SusC/RagA family TonB-linked outer membrane protein [Sunxiuqinia rutila]|uniref:SusC/RagA family TonB-linked outer membrane protein n=1 Tax=Sunxiuqinia rutila TaxID=1397841 RepID=UPI003D36E87E
MKKNVESGCVCTRYKQFSRKVNLLLTTLLFFSFSATASLPGFSDDLLVLFSSGAQEKKITGKVVDSGGGPLPNATVTVLGSTRGVITDFDGQYSIEVEATDKLVFSFIGMESQTVEVGNQTTINVTLNEKTDELDEVTIVAFGKQKKESVLSSIESVNTEDLKVPSSNLTTAFAGKMAGMISYQRSGEPGQDNAEFFVRGVTTFGYSKSPLILIDGIELSANDLARLQPDDIASFSIMKDATATALYGARGANGVILVTTKEGREGKAKVNIRFENSISQPTKDIEFADNITFMRKHNEAVLMRDPLGLPRYSEEKIIRTANSVDSYLYPDNNWKDMLTKDYTMNQRLNFNVSGGGKVARYYLAASLNQDNGILKEAEMNNFDNNIDFKKYLLRSNINLNITNSTEVAVRFHATFDDYTGPVHGGSELYKMALYANPVLFPAYYEPDENNQFTRHILYGNYEDGDYLNPYAELTRGYKDSDRSLILSQFEIEQSMDAVTEGLSSKLIFNTNREASSGISRFYNPYYYRLVGTGSEYLLDAINPESGTEYLGYLEDNKAISINTYYEASLRYDRTFTEKHGVSGLLVFIGRESKYSNPGSLQQSLPYRNLGLSGRFTYSYDSRYFTEFNFGYNGSERFAKNERFGFFPSVGVGYIISNEEFFTPLSRVVNNLKLKATYGLVGNDAIGSAQDRFFFMSEVNLNNNSKGGTFGTRYDYFKPGVSIGRYENDQIKWEIARKYNLGFELGLFSALDIMVDFFGESRSNILMNRITLANMGLQAGVRANVGEAKNHGVDISLDYNYSFNKDFWITGRGNFTFARSEMVKFEEPDYTSTPWVSRVGQSLDQVWGYVAERLFVDQAEINNSPTQFGKYLPGDIKYKDINGDGRITPLDKVPIGHPTVPEIIYGFGFSTGYKNWDLSCFFQGSALSSFWIDQGASAPFRPAPIPGGASQFLRETLSKRSHSSLLQAYAEDHWTPENQNLFALWPRLSENVVENNNQTSTWFMQDGAFLRLKSLEVGYTIPVKSIDRLRIYASGTNLLTFSKFKLWDPEMGGSGIGYPIQRVVNLGLQVNF